MSMLRLIITLGLSLTAISTANAQTMFLSISSDDYQITNVFSEVSTFSVDIEIDVRGGAVSAENDSP